MAMFRSPINVRPQPKPPMGGGGDGMYDLGDLAYKVGQAKRDELQDEMTRRQFMRMLDKLRDTNPNALLGMTGMGGGQLQDTPTQMRPPGQSGGIFTNEIPRAGGRGGVPNGAVTGTYMGSPNAYSSEAFWANGNVANTQREIAANAAASAAANAAGSPRRSDADIMAERKAAADKAGAESIAFRQAFAAKYAAPSATGAAPAPQQNEKVLAALNKRIEKLQGNIDTAKSKGEDAKPFEDRLREVLAQRQQSSAPAANAAPVRTPRIVERGEASPLLTNLSNREAMARLAAQGVPLTMPSTLGAQPSAQQKVDQLLGQGQQQSPAPAASPAPVTTPIEQRNPSGFYGVTGEITQNQMPLAGRIAGAVVGAPSAAMSELDMIREYTNQLNREQLAAIAKRQEEERKKRLAAQTQG